MHLPEPIQTYFSTHQPQQRQIVLSAFAPDAVVRDENTTYSGHESIGAWWQDAKQKYDHRAEPFELDVKDDTVRVRATVTGNFPSSPATLTYAFRRDGNRIAELEITA